MSKQLVEYVRLYIAPQSKITPKWFLKKIEAILCVCSEILFFHLFIKKDRPEDMVDYFFQKTNLPADFSAQFIDLKEISAPQAISAVHKEIKCADQYLEIFSSLVEIFLTRVAEIFFLSEKNIHQFWEEIRYDDELNFVFSRFNINELCSLSSDLPEFLDSYNISSACKKATHELIYSYILSLIISNES